MILALWMPESRGQEHALTPSGMGPPAPILPKLTGGWMSNMVSNFGASQHKFPRDMILIKSLTISQMAKVVGCSTRLTKSLRPNLHYFDQTRAPQTVADALVPSLTLCWKLYVSICSKSPIDILMRWCSCGTSSRSS